MAVVKSLVGCVVGGLVVPVVCCPTVDYCPPKLGLRRLATSHHQLRGRSRQPRPRDNRSVPAGQVPPARPTTALKAGGQWRDCLTAWQSPRPPLFSKGRTQPIHPLRMPLLPARQSSISGGIPCENRAKFDPRLIGNVVPSSCLAGAMKCTGEYRATVAENS